MRTISLLTLALFSAIIFPRDTSAQSQTVGLFLNDSTSFNGYTLFSPLRGYKTYLIDNCGFVVHEWTSPYNRSSSAYLLENGNLLLGGQRVQILDWNSNLIFDYRYHLDSAYSQHHDVRYLPNGNILVLADEFHDSLDCIANGRNPALLPEGHLLAERIVELQPTGQTTANVVWEWSLWDHLIQDFDSARANFGPVSDHPELMDINYCGIDTAGGADWLHANGIDYNPALDQILLSCRHSSEIYIIDHSTTTTTAATNSGGNSGKGGDFLYRWGNPYAWGAGTPGDQQLWVQHNPNWIPPGYPDENKIMVFSNGMYQPGADFSTVMIIDPPLDSAGNYKLIAGQAYGPASPDWTYTASNPTDFYSSIISGATRMANGNTLICEGVFGHLFEVDTAGNTVWDYYSPVMASGSVLSQGDTIPASPFFWQGTDNFIFRSYRYAPDYPGLTGKTLVPVAQLEQNPWPGNCQIYTSLDETPASGMMITVFPNPADQHVYIRSSTPTTDFSISDISGREMVKMEWRNGEGEVDCSGWPAGLYFIRMAGEVKKLVVQH